MFALKYYKQFKDKDLWFEAMTAIGPKTTDDPSKAFAFKDACDIAMHPIAMHSMFCAFDKVAHPAEIQRRKDENDNR